MISVVYMRRILMPITCVEYLHLREWFGGSCLFWYVRISVCVVESVYLRYRGFNKRTSVVEGFNKVPSKTNVFLSLIRSRSVRSKFSPKRMCFSRRVLSYNISSCNFGCFVSLFVSALFFECGMI